MLVYLLVALVAAAVIAAVGFARYRARGRLPPELEHEDPGPPEDRDTRWDPRERYEEPPSL